MLKNAAESGLRRPSPSHTPFVNRGGDDVRDEYRAHGRNAQRMAHAAFELDGRLVDGRRVDPRGLARVKPDSPTDLPFVAVSWQCVGC